MKVKSANPLILIVLLTVGAVIGGVLGEVFKQTVPILNYGKSVGLQPFTLDLSVIKLTFGFMLHLNLAGVIGLIIALFIFSRM
ncbi:DUF4321 domain-containing protein [Geosporobacter ferrireducens]|uniref:DUF4321 domain-containing protein n=1 Tax=Geosporobacter ferrireducens TaxID=1424294 RepID=A0A1D8GP73_9FIRM|nr:DUF4321 domain-containing protein [Geosporobacter ferrireducens]AOT72749.1 hypothetical protein Gferi_26250 [Geosporobacter ferrireducens]MTI55163.1 DUF4321 domain-containing protein [Geosporobacter ferrireducens]